MTAPALLRVAVPSPLAGYFDYLPPAGTRAADILPGYRVRVPFGRQKLVGVVIEPRNSSELPAERLKRILEVLDRKPILDEALIYLGQWAARYYQAAPGQVFEAILPTRLRRGDDTDVADEPCWALSETGRQLDLDELRRSPRQQHVLAKFRQFDRPLRAEDFAEEAAGWRPALKALLEKQLLQQSSVTPVLEPGNVQPVQQLNDEQAQAVDAIVQSIGSFRGWLLDGVTGSGKTEVYLAALRKVLAAGKQALVLVPEIGLTPQLLERFRAGLQTTLAISHSGLNDSERLAAWQAMSSGAARIMIGTRSAIFTPLPEPGMIIVDEEHDGSFKQQEGFRYSARDLAVVRAQRLGIPIVLGSATPSLESMANAHDRRYGHLHLTQRAGAAAQPSMQLIDIRGQRLSGGLSDQMILQIRRHLAGDGQVMLFLNRRGYAPRLICHQCGWLADCRRCDAAMTFHRQKNRLQCHHCDAEAAVPTACPDCGQTELVAMGQGTERLDETLSELFPDESVVRVDRDTTRRKGSLDALLDGIRTGRHRILIGTQMLAKGHDFPGLTMVGVLNADQGFYGIDFRAGERMAQQILQVAGRAGRADKPGEVFVQTHHPENALLAQLLAQGYPAFAASALAERKQAGLPPYGAIALLRAEAGERSVADRFLVAARQLGEASAPNTVLLLGPAAAPMARRAGRHRAQLLLQSSSRTALQSFLAEWSRGLAALPEARKVRWSLDVDPLDLF